MVAQGWKKKEDERILQVEKEIKVARGTPAMGTKVLKKPYIQR